MRVKELYQQTLQRLKKAGVPEAEIEAGLLLGNLFQKSRTELLLADFEVSEEVCAAFNETLIRRLRREPTAYIMGEQEFWSLPFMVSPDVLIPRPETEFLLETVFSILKKQPYNEDAPVADLCTGSGVIAVVLALELPKSRVYGLDRSCDALRIARQNSLRHRVYDRISFICADLFSALKPEQRFGLIVSNPPYVAREDLKDLQPEVRDFEPRLALDGGRRGVEVIDAISAGLDRVLRPGGWFFMEIGADQGDYVVNRFNSLHKYDSVLVHYDYAGLPRVLQARKIIS